ncbi:MAG: WD40 repeat domain-containing protein [Lentisphaeraceae bacterium]|nr:WD40 repeat domain-containing protein [Lentisphaeraceae bacterium]
MFRTLMLLIFFLFVQQTFSQAVHGNRGHYAEYDPTGKYIALGGDDIILIDSNNNEKRVVNKDNPEGYALCFSNDGRFLAAETNDYNIYIYDLNNPAAAPAFFQGLNKKDGVQSRLKFSPDNKMLATSNAEKMVIYDLTKGNEGNVLLSVGIDPSNAQRTLAAFDVSDDWKTFFFNMQVISVSKDAAGKMKATIGRIIKWDRVLTSLSALSADGKKVVLANRNGTEQRVYDLGSGEVIARNSNSKTYALAANKDFSKIYMNQLIWDLKSQTVLSLNTRDNVGKNDKNHISIAPDNSEFAIGLFRFNGDGRFKDSLQVELTVFNRVEINGDQALFYRDYDNSNKFDVHVALISEGLRGRSNRNLPNTRRLSTALATSPDGTFGINHLAKIIRRDTMTVSAPIFGIGGSKGVAAAISSGNLVAMANQQRIFMYEFPDGIKKMNSGKRLKAITLQKRIPSGASVMMEVSPDNSQVALAVTTGNSTDITLYGTDGTISKTISATDVNDITFSHNSQRFYYTSGKKLNCLSKDIQDGKTLWFADDTYSFFADSGKIIAIALSKDDVTLAYTTHNGWNKVVRARYGVELITCVMLPNDRLNITKN